MHHTMGRWRNGFLSDASAGERDFTRMGNEARAWFHLDAARAATLRIRGRAIGSRTIVVHTNGRAEIFDLASLNGTFVNGRRLADRSSLRSGDVVRLGRDLCFTAVLYNPLGN